ncbi:hypothetical protein KVT40_002490 [Elsinoe batatas]|uniref:Uncharacterized protein n=1 Tax=Elsinoe batatas TaxID=2601811 RepID=A0A8K0L488_9PEZI|nr:hypothetical protein KVT40_002490 [Elsinoe batatas]
MQSFAAILALAGLVAAQNAQPSGGVVSPNVASCTSNYQICTSSGTSAATCEAQRSACQTSCTTKYDTCRVPGPQGSANQAQCFADYAGCLGFNPNDANRTVSVTQVVQSFTTFCPGPTTLVYNGQSYVATGPTVLTVTNCPCTVTRAVSSAPPAATTPATTPATNFVPSGTTNSTPPYTPAVFKGESNRMVAAGLSFAAAGAGALAFFL